MKDRTEKFEIAVQYILRNEGEEFSDDPEDHGGATKWGVTLKTYRTMPGKANATVDDIKRLTSEAG
jgi:lysozyme family protein